VKRGAGWTSLAYINAAVRNDRPPRLRGGQREGEHSCSPKRLVSRRPPQDGEKDKDEEEASIPCRPKGAGSSTH
jgi:hypothetical protein